MYVFRFFTVKMRMIWMMVTKKPRAKIATRAIFCLRRNCKFIRTGRGRAMMRMSKPRLVPARPVQVRFV